MRREGVNSTETHWNPKTTLSNPCELYLKSQSMKKSPDSSIANCFYTTILILQQHVETKSTKIYPLFTVPLCHAMFVGERFCNYSWLTATEKRKKKKKTGLVMKARGQTAFLLQPTVLWPHRGNNDDLQHGNMHQDRHSTRHSQSGHKRSWRHNNMATHSQW